MSGGLRAVRAALLPAARRWRDRLDAPEIRQARQLARRVRREPPLDVLYLADSMATFVSPHDSDRRQLSQMLADELQPDLSVLTIGGGGYHPLMFGGYLRLLRGVEKPPVVILPLSVRIADPTWLYHPSHGHPAATVALQGLRPDGATWRMRRIIGKPTAKDMERHDRAPHPSFSGADLTVGDHRLRLKDPESAGLDNDARLALLYAYHHTRALVPTDDGLANMTQLAALLREMQLRVVPYQTPIPYEKGCELLGPDFLERARANLALLDGAWRRGYPEAEIVRTGEMFTTGEFLDPEDGSEHLNEVGRRKLLDAIVTQVRALSSAVPAQP